MAALATKTRRRATYIRRESWMRVKDPAALRRWRKQRHYSQEDLAFLVRKSQTTIYLLETGRMKTLTEGLAVAIAARLDVPWDALFDAEEDKPLPDVTTAVHSTRRSAAA